MYLVWLDKPWNGQLTVLREMRDSAMIDLLVGDILRMKSVKTFRTPNLEITYSAGRKRVFVAVLLGSETVNSDELDLVAAMGRLGWVRAEAEEFDVDKRGRHDNG